MTTSGLLQVFKDWSRDGRPMVLASVFETEGSTYSKTGAQMLINADGDFQGMLSGGCLEGDLAERAREVIRTGETQAVTYDLGQNDEELWGLGVGCDGLMRIFLQPLVAASSYEPFASMATAFAGDSVEAAAIVIESADDNLKPGSAIVTSNGEVSYSNVADDEKLRLGALLGPVILDGNSRMSESNSGRGAVKCLLSALRPPPAILVLGAGLDAGPVVRFACELGWRVTVQDHRPAYVESGSFDEAEQVLCMPVDALSTHLDLDRFAAAIVMSHHLNSDRSYLGQIAKSGISYVGLLGPRDRRRRLLDELGETGNQLKDRVHGPAGLDIGGRGPASIALSIIGEMHQVLMRNPE
jgi:xanthine/CO dehydrogenase XdhC/CoxF family maturation factor